MCYNHCSNIPVYTYGYTLTYISDTWTIHLIHALYVQLFSSASLSSHSAFFPICTIHRCIHISSSAPPSCYILFRSPCLLCPAKGLHCSSVKFIMHISSNTSILITNINCMIKHRVMFKHQHFCGLLFSL